ncbi:MAG TPA: helix-turn-helix transcriptional regulator, partial [Ramlibacter sp.]|nr:helix-turn-helix transcriptional regulator [Ramlibacter sp.]
EVDFGHEPRSVSADIQIARSPLGGLMNVDTSWSVVQRTQARASASPTGNLLVYLIDRGGSWFQNDKGQEFTTSAGSIVVGSQDAAYKAAAAAGQRWRFQALSVPEQLFSRAAAPIRHQGFQMVAGNAPLHGMLVSYLARLCRDFAGLDRASLSASLRALDELLSAALGSRQLEGSGLASTVADERLRLALRYIEDNLQSTALSPISVANHLCVSTRQMHRVFERAGKTLAAEIRRIRVERAASMLRGNSEMSVTDIAFACGFDSLATFYRCFKAEFQATASEFRHGE